MHALLCTFYFFLKFSLGPAQRKCRALRRVRNSAGSGLGRGVRVRVLWELCFGMRCVGGERSTRASRFFDRSGDGNPIPIKPGHVDIRFLGSLFFLFIFFVIFFGAACPRVR